MGGYAGQAALTCTATPAEPSCMICPGTPPQPSCNPMQSTMTVAAGSAVPFQVIVNTPPRSIAPGTGVRPKGADRDVHWPLRALCLLLAGSAALAATFAKHRKGRRGFSIAQAGAVGILLTIGAACGGTGGAVSTSPGTTPGTSILTVTASAGGTTTSLTLTLTVN
jgi:hypothetical protein